MMDEIKQLISQAQPVEDLIIPRDKIHTIHKFEDFKMYRGELYYYAEEHRFLKKLVGTEIKWIQYQHQELNPKTIKQEAQPNQLLEFKEELRTVKELHGELMKWSTTFKEWVEKTIAHMNSEIEKIKKGQETGYVTLKENYELKIKKLDEKIQAQIDALKK